jgi:hypothetical protein
VTAIRPYREKIEAAVTQRSVQGAEASDGKKACVLLSGEIVGATSSPFKAFMLATSLRAGA